MVNPLLFITSSTPDFNLISNGVCVYETNASRFFRLFPRHSRQECKKSCPVVKMGKLCIEVNPTDKKAFISEDLCIGCGICVKKWVLSPVLPSAL
jgi:ferredoxin